MFVYGVNGNYASDQNNKLISLWNMLYNLIQHKLNQCFYIFVKLYKKIKLITMKTNLKLIQYQVSPVKLKI